MKKQKSTLIGALLVLFLIIIGFVINQEQVQAGQLIICDPIEIEICSICGNDYTDGGVCSHHKGEIYNGTVCSPYESEICTVCNGDYNNCSHISGDVYGGVVCETYRRCDICGNNYDDGSVCPHHEGEAYGGEECTTYVIRICNMCGSDYDNGDLCPHHEGEFYEEGMCETFIRRICSICGNDYDNGDECPHYEGEVYGGDECTTSIIKICNICGNNYYNASLCPHIDGTLYDLGLFKESDFDLEPEVQQMISYYDDMYFYSDTAYEMGVITHGEDLALKTLCREKVDELRANNALDLEDKHYIFETVLFIGGFLPYVGNVCDVLSMILDDTMIVQAATLDVSAVTKINDNQDIIIQKVASKNLFKHTVYELYDKSGNVKYVGRTRQQLEVRKRQHWNSDSEKYGLNIRVAELDGKFLENLNYAQARGLEHEVFEKYGGVAAIKSGKLLNKIRPLNLKKKTASEFIEKALRFLGRIS